jgi:2-dehydropantoate 2-reductase
MSIGIVGSGAIGGYLAVALSAAGCPVVLYNARTQSRAPVLVRIDGSVQRPWAPIQLTSAPADLAAVSLCIVSVKSPATRDVADVLASALADDVPVVSFQNGLDNLRTLRKRLGDRVHGGVVTFHVLREAHYRRRASMGKLIMGGGDVPRVQQLAAWLRQSGERVELAEDMDSVIYGKLLLNLNNGICAATGRGIRDVLLSRDCRWAFAQCVREGLQVMRAAGIEPARVSALPPGALAKALTLPDAIVARASVAFTRMSPVARSSTLADLDRGRRTEIDDLNGASVKIANQLRIDAAINSLVVGIVHEHEALAVAGRRPRYLSPEELRSRIESLRPRISNAAA